MQTINPRPTLTSFRALAFHGENRGEADGSPWTLELQQDIQLGLAVPAVQAAGLQASVKIKLSARAVSEKGGEEVANFLGEYEAKFLYAPDVVEATVTPLIEQDDYQYLLVAQAFPLAMTHFRRELQALGFDARNLPLGLP